MAIAAIGFFVFVVAFVFDMKQAVRLVDDLEDTDDEGDAEVEDNKSKGECEEQDVTGKHAMARRTMARLQSLLMLLAALLFVWRGKAGASVEGDDEDEEQERPIERTARSLRAWAPRGKRRYVRYNLPHEVSAQLRNADAEDQVTSVSRLNNTLMPEARKAAAAFVAGLEAFLEIRDAKLARELMEQCTLDWSMRIVYGSPPSLPEAEAASRNELLRVVFFTRGVEPEHAMRLRSRGASFRLEDRQPGAIIVPGPATEVATAGRVLSGDGSLVSAEVAGDLFDRVDIVAVAVLTANRTDASPIKPLRCLPFFLTAEEATRYGASSD